MITELFLKGIKESQNHAKLILGTDRKRGFGLPSKTVREWHLQIFLFGFPFLFY